MDDADAVSTHANDISTSLFHVTLLWSNSTLVGLTSHEKFSAQIPTSVNANIICCTTKQDKKLRNTRQTAFTHFPNCIHSLPFMAHPTFPVIGKAAVLHGFRSLPSPQLKNGLCIAPFSHGAGQFSTLTTDQATWGLLKCKAMAQNGQPNQISAVLGNSTRKEIVQSPRSASEIVREFYSRINNRELDFVGELIAENCVYEDLVFPQPFVGRKDIIDFFKKFSDATSTDLQFVIDDITSQDSSAVGVTWHLEWRGKPFPFSKGCSFYRCEIFNGKRQIIYGRDSVEPATKPGDLALVAIKAVTSLLDRFPQLADRL